MSSVPVITPLQAQAWRKQMIKEVISGSVWHSLSNRVDTTSQVPNAGTRKIPDAVVQWVTDSFAKGIQKTTVPFMEKLNEMVKVVGRSLRATRKPLRCVSSLSTTTYSVKLSH